MSEVLYQIMGRHRSEPLPERKPSWLKVKAPGGPAYVTLKGLMRELGLHTVCEEARCPNIGECWEHKAATFMILGDVCTRNCTYCAVAHGTPTAYDPLEPVRLAEAVERMGLRHVVITSVDRDDLVNGGAEIFAACIRAVSVSSPWPARYFISALQRSPCASRQRRDHDASSACLTHECAYATRVRMVEYST